MQPDLTDQILELVRLTSTDLPRRVGYDPEKC